MHSTLAEILAKEFDRPIIAIANGDDVSFVEDYGDDCDPLFLFSVVWDDTKHQFVLDGRHYREGKSFDCIEDAVEFVITVGLL